MDELRRIAEAEAEANDHLERMGYGGTTSTGHGLAAVALEIRALRLTLAAYEETTVVVEETTSP